MGLIQTAESIEQHVKDAYTALQASGASLPEQRNLANLAGTIEGADRGGDGTLWGTLYTTVYPEGLVLETYQDYMALGIGGDSNTYLAVNGKNIRKYSVVKFSFGRGCVYAPDYFLYQCTQLRILEHSEVLLGIGQFFCSCSGLNGQPGYTPYLDLSHVESVGTYLLYDCRAFGSVTQPPIVNIGECPPPTDAGSLSCVVKPFDGGFYTIALAGANAAAWKAALPDSTSSPYRKLILA